MTVVVWQQGTVKVTHMSDESGVVADRDNLQAIPPLMVSHRILATGEANVTIEGELDIATAETAVRYVRQVIDHHHGSVIVDLAMLSFCDARGLNALLGIAGHAQREGCPFRLTSPSPSLIKLLRITGLDRRLLPPPR